MLQRGLYVVGGGLLLALLYVSLKRSHTSATAAKPMALDELAALFSGDSDRMIVQETKSRQLKFISGRLKVQLAVDELHVLLQLVLYFQDATGKWVEKTAKNQLPVGRLMAEALRELKERETVTYEIEAPSVPDKVAAGEHQQGG